MTELAGPGDRWKEIWAVFHEAVERAVGERSTFLDEACGDDEELRREVEELLAAHEEGLPVLDGSLPLGLGPPSPRKRPSSGPRRPRARVTSSPAASRS